MKGEPMKEILNFRVTNEDVTMPNGEVLTEADFERMALEAETMEIDVERLVDRQRRGVGRDENTPHGRASLAKPSRPSSPPDQST